jgi:uncharacterized protein (TIGR02996 family)
MSEEQSFLGALKASPFDDTTRLVYADWLDDRGESARATYLRAVVEYAQRPATNPADAGFQEFCAASEVVDASWRRAVGSRFELELTAVGPRGLISAIKRVREQFGFWLGTAKGVVEAAPTPLEAWVCLSSAAARYEKLTRRPTPNEAGTVYTIRPARLPPGVELAEKYDLVLCCQHGLVLTGPQLAHLQGEPDYPPTWYHPAVDIASEQLNCAPDEAVTRLEAGPLPVARGLALGEVVNALIMFRARLSENERPPSGVLRVVPSPTE